MENEDTILKIKNVTKCFPGVKALDSINVELKKGEVHALLGENGAGKSTLVKIISGVYKKNKGEILLNDKICDFNSPKEAFKNGISVIHQETSLIPQLTVLQNIFLGMEYLTTPLNIFNEKKMSAIFNAHCLKLNFDLPQNTQARELSVAEQKMTEILKAMVHEASFIIMDEPTDSLSETEINKLVSIIQDLKKNNITILYITHHLEEVFKICDRFTVLRDGKKIDTKNTSDVNKDDIVKMMIGGEIIKLPERNINKTNNYPIIKIQGITQSGKINNISFKGYKGEILGITGVIGSGKTELAKLIFGVEKPDSGEIYIEGKLSKIKSPVHAVEAGIGMLQEDRKNFGLLLEHEVYKNITLTALGKFTKYNILSTKKELNTTLDIINKLNIKVTNANQTVKNLSGGNQQKIVIGKWLVANPKILIMDEPTRGIDVGAKVEVYKIMRNLADNGTCIIFISSEVPEIIQVSDRILIMKNGKLITEYNRGASQEEITHVLLGGNDI